MMQVDLGRTGRPVAERALDTRTSDGESGRDVVHTIGAGIRHGYTRVGGHVAGTPSTPAGAG